MRKTLSVFLAAWIGLFPLPLRLSALTDDEKKNAFLKSRTGTSQDSDSDESASPTPKPKVKSKASPSPNPAHKKAAPTPEETPKPKAKKSPSPAATAASSKSKKKSAEPEPTPKKSGAKKSPSPSPKPSSKPSPKSSPKPIPSPSAAPRHREDEPETPRKKPAAEPTPQPFVTPLPTPFPTPLPVPSPTPAPAIPSEPFAPAAPVTIEKSGVEEETGFEPAQPRAKRHWWQIFSSGSEREYHYLTRAVRDAIDRAPVKRHRWRYIVVHNSGTRQGNAKIFDFYHRNTRKMPNGLAYHFVIGNGSSSGNGEIEIGSRWTRQINGGHVHSDYLNNIALGICLVGDFNRDKPTQQQLAALDELIDYLRERVGKIDRKSAIVKAHREINPPQWPTDCPGDRFPYDWLHRRYD